jgi:hypothetical protein
MLPLKRVTAAGNINCRVLKQHVMRFEYGETRRRDTEKLLHGKRNIESSKTRSPIKATETEYLNISPTTLKRIYDQNTSKKG